MNISKENFSTELQELVLVMPKIYMKLWISIKQLNTSGSEREVFFAHPEHLLLALTQDVKKTYEEPPKSNKQCANKLRNEIWIFSSPIIDRNLTVHRVTESLTETLISSQSQDTHRLLNVLKTHHGSLRIVCWLNHERSFYEPLCCPDHLSCPTSPTKYFFKVP